MSENWNQNRKDDPYYQQAKKENYRSRASYKLLQLNKKFNIIKKNQRVVDFGAAPGGWSQVALELVGEEGVVVGVDLQRIKPFEEGNFIAIRGDFTSPDILENLYNIMEGKADVILSDASPKLTGIKDVDQIKALDLANAVLTATRETLKDGGALVMKAFQGEEFPDLLKQLKKEFRVVRTTKPPSSKKKSMEMYLVARGFRMGKN